MEPITRSQELCVHNLGDDMDDEKLRKYFSRFGTVISAQVCIFVNVLRSYHVPSASGNTVFKTEQETCYFDKTKFLFSRSAIILISCFV